MCLSAFVSALVSHEMGRHKLPIIIIIIIITAMHCRHVTRASDSIEIPDQRRDCSDNDDLIKYVAHVGDPVSFSVSF